MHTRARDPWPLLTTAKGCRFSEVPFSGVFNFFGSTVVCAKYTVFHVCIPCVNITCTYNKCLEGHRMVVIWARQTTPLVQNSAHAHDARKL